MMHTGQYIDEREVDMLPKELISKIYLGDTGCTAIHINFWLQEIKIHTSGIRMNLLRPNSWEYEKSINNACLVFSEVETYSINPYGAFANDYIENFYIDSTEQNQNGKHSYSFVLEVGYTMNSDVSEQGLVTICVKSCQFWIEDPLHPGIRITE